MRFSVIINCYNTLPLIKQCVEQVLATTENDTEILLINNHPPYREVLDYLKSLKHPRVRALDPGKNIGCMPGFQLGAKNAIGEYLVKLDDDVIVPRKNWILAMYQALKDHKKLAYVSLKPNKLKSSKRAEIVKNSRYTLEFHDTAIYFWCMMIRKSLWKKHFLLTDLPLYGVGERNYSTKAKELRLKKAYLISHVCSSLGRTAESDPLYGAWKLFYVKLKDKSDFPEWKKTFFLGEEEVKIMRSFGYPEEQIQEIRTLLSTGADRS